MGETMKKYILELNKTQVHLLKDALEEYFRIRMGQWSDLADSLASKNIDLSQKNEHRKETLERYLIERDAIEKVLKCAGDIIWSGPPFNNPKSEKQLIAEDIWQVIRHELWKNNPGGNDWCVDSREPLKGSNEPLPKMRIEEK